MPKAIDAVKRHGRHYTPTGLAEFLAKRSCESLRGGIRRVRVLDPACGDGELLLAAAAELALRRWTEVELVGCDLDAEAVQIAEARLAAAGLQASLVSGDFLQLADQSAGQFDMVITNPPYVRTQALGEVVSRRLASEFGLRGRVDLTHAFVALAPKLLSPGGVLGLLCSNRFLSTKAGVNVREVLMRDLRIRELFDLGDTKLFAAAVLPAVVIASNDAPASGAVPFARAYELAVESRSGLPLLFDALIGDSDAEAAHGEKVVRVEVGVLAVGRTVSVPWKLTSAVHDEHFTVIESATWKTFGDLAKIRVGIKTTADAVFIRDDWQSQTEYAVPEAELLIPLLTHDNLTAWHPPTDPKTTVLYPYDLRFERRTLLDLSGYPQARQYFAQHEERLRSRRYVTNGGREWYEIWVPHRPALWAGPKIVFPDISERPRFALDRSGAIVNGDCYWISVADLPDEDIAYLMIGVANSDFTVNFYDHVCGNKLYSGRRRWITQYVNTFPVPNPDTESAREIIAISRKLCQPSAPDDTDLLTRLNVAVTRAFRGEESGLFPDVLF